MSAATSPEVAWFIIAAIAVTMVIGCLRVIGLEYGRAVRWYDLKVSVQRLRHEQADRLDRLRAGDGWQPRWSRSTPPIGTLDADAAPAPSLMRTTAKGSAAPDVEVTEEVAEVAGDVETLEPAATA